MDPLATRTLGRTRVALTQLGFGGAPLGELFTRVSEADATATLQAAWDADLRYYDTAPGTAAGTAAASRSTGGAASSTAGRGATSSSRPRSAASSRPRATRRRSIRA